MGRSSGRSAAGAAAYRVGGRSPASALAYRVGGVLTDPLTGARYDYRAKGRLDGDGFGVTHTEILAPANAPEWVYDLQALLNRVEAAEKRKDAQFFRELEISLPRELSHDDHKALVRAFVARHCVAAGMVAIVALHNERAADGGTNPHAHILLTMRSLTPEGFGPKQRQWNDRALLRDWREAWADLANDFLAARGFERRLDHRSFKDRDIELEPDIYVGPVKSKGFEGVIAEERQAQRRAAKARNLDKAAARPDWILDQISRLQSTFTEREIAAFLYRYLDVSTRDDRFAGLMQAVLASPQLLRIASDIKGPQRYTARSLFECEVRLAKTADRLAQREGPAPTRTPWTDLSPAQSEAARHLVSGGDLRLLEGLAGSGKTHLLSAVRAAFEAEGRPVRGVALSAIVARNLGDGAGMPAQTLASLLRDLQRAKPFAPLARGEAIILDEAGLVGSRQMEALLAHVERAGAKLILVGDRRQLQSIEAGAAFRALADRHGAARLDDVRRQVEPWQRQATQDFGQGKTLAALSAYRAQGAFHAEPNKAAAMEALVTAWMRDRASGGSQIILAHRRADAAQLNQLVRGVLRAEGALGPDHKIKVAVAEEMAGELVERRETRAFAEGDRILFTRNDPKLGVENGALGIIMGMRPDGVMQVRLADGAQKVIDPAAYPYLEQGCALTVHKAQGVTVDRAYALASDTFDAHLAYVALTRHRTAVELFYGRDEFQSDARLLSVLSRERAKDTTLDYEARKRAERELPSLPAGPPAFGERRLTAAEERRQRIAAFAEREREERARRERGLERD